MIGESHIAAATAGVPSQGQINEYACVHSKHTEGMIPILYPGESRGCRIRASKEKEPRIGLNTVLFYTIA